MIREHVAGLMAEHAAQLLGVKQLYQLGVDDHERLPGADRQRVGDRERRQVELGHRLEVERRVGARVGAPDVAQLILAEAHRRAEDAAAQCPLVAELDDLANHAVQVRDRLQRGRRGSIGRMLIGLRGDPLELVALGRKRHVGVTVSVATAQLSTPPGMTMATSAEPQAESAASRFTKRAHYPAEPAIPPPTAPRRPGRTA